MNLLEAVAKCKPFAAPVKETSRAAMNHVAQDRGFLIATDGRVMAVAETSGADRSKENKVVIAGTEDELPGFPQWERVLVSQDKLSTRIAIGKRDAIPALEFLIKSWKAALKAKVRGVSASSPNVVEVEVLDAGYVRFTLHDTRVSCTINGGYDTDNLLPAPMIGFNAEYLLKCLKAVDGCDATLGIQADGDTRACVVTGEPKDFQVVIMPINLRKA